jgi:hypothetical protein
MRADVAWQDVPFLLASVATSTTTLGLQAAEEKGARAIANLLLGRMKVAPAEALVFVHFDDGTWATELRVDDPGFEQVEPNDPIPGIGPRRATRPGAFWPPRYYG